MAKKSGILSFMKVQCRNMQTKSIATWLLQRLLHFSKISYFYCCHIDSRNQYNATCFNQWEHRCYLSTNQVEEKKLSLAVRDYSRAFHRHTTVSVNDSVKAVLRTATGKPFKNNNKNTSQIYSTFPKLNEVRKKVSYCLHSCEYIHLGLIT